MSFSKKDADFMAVARKTSLLSTDRSTQVGCVIVGVTGQIISKGWNTTPMGCSHTEARHERPAKYLWTEHAERNAIYQAARRGKTTLDATAYVPWYPCADCARSLINSGIARLVACRPDFHDERWGADFRVVDEMLLEAGLLVDFEPPL